MNNKISHIIIFFFLITLTCLFHCQADNIVSDSQAIGLLHDNEQAQNLPVIKGKHSSSVVCSKNSVVDFSLADMRLFADSNSLLHDVEFYAQTLDKEDTYPLQSDMIAIGGNYFAYRLLPHGEHFTYTRPAHIEIAYNPNDLPHGFKPHDIYS